MPKPMGNAGCSKSFGYTRRLVQLTVGDAADMLELMDMLLAKKRAPDRKEWLESKGNMAQIEV